MGNSLVKTTGLFEDSGEVGVVVRDLFCYRLDLVGVVDEGLSDD